MKILPVGPQIKISVPPWTMAQGFSGVYATLDEKFLHISAAKQKQKVVKPSCP